MYLIVLRPLYHFTINFIIFLDLEHECRFCKIMPMYRSRSDREGRVTLRRGSLLEWLGFGITILAIILSLYTSNVVTYSILGVGLTVAIVGLVIRLSKKKLK